MNETEIEKVWEKYARFGNENPALVGKGDALTFFSRYFLSLITKIKTELEADKENPVSGVGALQLLKERL